MANSDFWKNAVNRLGDFYKHQYTEENAENLIFEMLKKIIPFSSGTIYMKNFDILEVRYSCANKTTEDFSIKENLIIHGCIFGIIEINRATVFTEDEKQVFSTCASIISNIIKDIELSSIIKMQVKALQEGLEESKKQNKRITASDKVKNNFLANVSHELRSPLNSIIGFSELLQEKFIGELNEKQKEYVDDIQMSGLHLLGMINEILDISKIEAAAMKLNITKFNLLQNASETINILKPLYEKKNINLTLNIPKELEITVDYQKLQQIFFNLLSNAIKFTPNNGKITISAEETPKFVTIFVEDNGIGIDKKHHKRIFKKFEQIQSNKGEECSTGLGLTITQELIKLHGGKITLESKPTLGSIFIVTFKKL